MQKLAPGELRKKNSNTGEQRITILLDAITNSTTLQYAADEKEFKLKNNKANKDAVAKFISDGINGKAMQLETADGILISSSQIGKSAIFGGGAGAGGGTDQTAIAESLQCIYCQIIVNEPSIELSKINKTKLKAAYQKVHVGSTSFDQCYDLDSKWHASAYFGAKKLLADGYINSNHTFHRDDAIMKKIYTQKTKAFRNSKLTSLTDDKWNPGDIWAIDKNFDIEKMPVKTIQEYNNSLIRGFRDKKIVGISLKKVEREKFIKTSKVNDTPARPDDVKFVSSLPSGKTARSSFYSSKGGEVILTNKGVRGSLDVRANSSMGTLKAEITGKTARQGGAGWGKLQEYAEEYLPSTFKLPDNGVLKTDARMIKNAHSQKLTKFWNMAKDMDSTLNKDEFMKEIPQKELEWIHAKLGVTYFLYALHKNKASKKSDAVVNSVFNYAGSQSKLSSVHVKVYE